MAGFVKRTTGISLKKIKKRTKKGFKIIVGTAKKVGKEILIADETLGKFSRRLNRRTLDYFRADRRNAREFRPGI